MTSKALTKINQNVNIKGIIQVGSNSGQEVRLFKRYTDNIICFEPIPEVFMQLISTNTGVICYNFALGDKNEFLEMNISSNNGESSSFLNPLNHLSEFDWVKFDKKEVFEVKRFDSLKIDISDYNVIFTDTQGFEINVLKGFGDLLNSIDYIYSEYIQSNQYEDDSSLSDIENYLANYNFVVDEVYPVNKNWGNVLLSKKKPN